MDFGEFCKQLVDRTDIVKVVSRYVKLSRSGSDLVAPCPFHSESKPSFRVRPDKQYYHCFGCHKGGDVIGFLAEIERIDRIDAIKILADEANMTLPEFTKGGQKFDKNKRLRLYSLMKEAAKRYNENLTSEKAEKAVAYITRRQIPQNIVMRFGMGYSIPGDMVRHLSSKGYTTDEMRDAGITAQRGDSWYDVFSERLIFPIINNTGEVVAFGGRALRDEDFPKYRNSAQTEIFDKSRTVYALNLLKKKRLKGGTIDHIIMCEGYMDVIALHKAGFDTAVASMGTALTLNQAKQLKNYTDKIIISYDGDGAGQKATLRGLDILREAGLTVKVARLPEGLDPDDVINKMGVDAYRSCLSSAVTLTEFKLGSIKKKHDLTDPDGKSKYALEAIACIKQLGNPVEIEEYLRVVQEETDYSMEILKKQSDITEIDDKDKMPQINTQIVRFDDNATFILAAILSGAEFAYIDEEMIGLMPDEFTKKVMRLIVWNRLNGLKDVSNKLYIDLDEDESGKLTSIIEYNFIDGDNKSKYDDCVRSLKAAEIERRIEELKKGLSGANMKEILIEVQTLSKQLKELKYGG